MCNHGAIILFREHTFTGNTKSPRKGCTTVITVTTTEEEVEAIALGHCSHKLDNQ